MKKVLLTAVLLAACLSGRAELPQVESVRAISLPDGAVAMNATISPDAQFVVYTDAGREGLTKVTLDGDRAQALKAEGNISDIAISADGSRIVFRSSTIGKDRLRRTSLVSIDAASGASRVLVAPTRHLNAGVSLNDGNVTAVSDGAISTMSLKGNASPVAAPVASIDYGHLTYTADGQTRTLDPQGRGSYVWPSISPDGTRILYYLTGQGCYVCDLQGKVVADLGAIRAARWLDNGTIVGMNDIDNGEYVTASNIIAADLDGNRKALTGDEVIAVFPSASADGKHITFTSPEGKLYLITLK